MSSSIPPVDPALPGLCIAQATRAEPFLLEGGRVRFVATQTRAGGQALFRDNRGEAGITAAIRPEAMGHAANLVLYPGISRRDFAGPQGSVVETVVAARTLPFLAWQLTGTARDEAKVHIDLAAPSVAHEVDTQADGVVLTADGQELRLRITPAPVSIEVATAGGGVTASLTLAAGDTHTLVLASGTPTEAASALQAAQHLAGHAIRTAKAEEDTLRARSGIEAVDDGLAWALRRTRGLLAERPGAAVSLGLAAIVMGHREAAEAAVSMLRVSDLVAAGLLSARMGSTFGDTGSAADLATTLLADGPGLESDLLDLTSESLADALQYGATPDTIARLRMLGARATAHRPQGRPSAGGVALPMAGGSRPLAPQPASQWLRGLLVGDPGEPALVMDVRSSRARRAASAFRSDPDRAWADWRALLDEGLAGGPAGPATWDDLITPSHMGDPTKDQPAATGEMMLAFAHGLLGLAADAPVGRLRLAPRMPGHLTAFQVDGIPIGDGTIRMTYERSGSEVLFTLEPERIGVPPLLVFEPSVSGEIRSLRVDGDAAELDLREDGGRTVVPVQLPLDSVRTLGFKVG